MSVYVDNLVKTKTGRHWLSREACHLFADTLRELHECAGLIGLSRSWFQGHKGSERRRSAKDTKATKSEG
jgi:hypothetical protein